MTPNEYQDLASRTICPQTGPSKLTELGAQVLHSVIGLQGECGELASAVEKWIWYNQNLDDTNLIEEFGDCLWYIAEGLAALGISLEDCMNRNISKLKVRFPYRYSDDKTAEENRDRAAERKILEQGYKEHCEREVQGLPQHATVMPETLRELEQTGQGWAEPVETSSEPWLKPNAYGDMPGEVCCQRAVNGVCFEHDKTNYTTETYDQSKAVFVPGVVAVRPPDNVSYRHRKPLNRSYDRYCYVCEINRVYRTSKEAICGNCWAKMCHGNKKQSEGNPDAKGG